MTTIRTLIVATTLSLVIACKSSQPSEDPVVDHKATLAPTQVSIPKTALGNVLRGPKGLRALYSQRASKLAWTPARRRVLAQAVAGSVSHGLLPSDYHYAALVAAEGRHTSWDLTSCILTHTSAWALILYSAR